MRPGSRNFIFPAVDPFLCVDCGLCLNRCPSNKSAGTEQNVKAVYAAWSKDKKNRRTSSSGGIFTVLAKSILRNGGAVAGAVWNDAFHPQHVLVDTEEDLALLQGSKYAQSITSDIYIRIKEQLLCNKQVLFSGTPCQVAALKAFLGKEYDGLFLIDVVCHGVPSNAMLDRYYAQFGDRIKSVKLRKKDPYWDYCYVQLEFEHLPSYKALTIDDDYFNLFNIGYSLRESCHNCQYATTHRQSDVTLADFWGYTAHSFRTRNYNKGTSLILVNSEKGKRMIKTIRKDIFLEESTIDKAMQGNKCLSEPFKLPPDKLTSFWKDYEAGAAVKELNEKYAANTFQLPKHLALRRVYYKWKWILGK